MAFNVTASPPNFMLIRFGYDLTFWCPEPTQMLCLLDAHPDNNADIVWRGPLRATPSLKTNVYVDDFGNEVLRFTAPAGETRISRDTILASDGQPQILAPDAQEAKIANLPTEVLRYLFGSRYCETDRLGDIAWELFGATPRGWRRVQAICDFVNAHLEFGYPHARSTRTALEAFRERVGVCRDFAHLAVTLCRCLNIPARYANGFLGDIGVAPDPAPMDYNAWFEAYLDGQWFVFDARHNVPRIGRIPVARGRDAADIAMMTSFGPHRLDQFRVWTAEIGTTEDLVRDPQFEGQAASAKLPI